MGFFSWFKSFKKKEEPEKTAEAPVRTCSVAHIRRVDLSKSFKYSDNDSDDYSCDTTEYLALDIVLWHGVYYAVKTSTYKCETYDRYSSPMNTEKRRTSLEIVQITKDMEGLSKEELLAYIEKSDRILSSANVAPYYEPEAYFVEKRVEIALYRNESEKRVAEKTAKGEASPNAVLITYDGKPLEIYIDDFSTNLGLATALDCDEVTVYYDYEYPEIAYFYDAEPLDGRIYNEVASELFGESLEGAVVTCARNEESDECLPLSKEDVKMIKELIKVKKKLLK